MNFRPRITIVAGHNLWNHDGKVGRFSCLSSACPWFI